ncbi:MAG: ABC transporter permease [Planctomycetia bacterium]|nr:ABC transporter permease [Planctomycetia bacterium]
MKEMKENPITTENTVNTETVVTDAERTGFRDWIWMFTELRGYRELLWQMFLRDFRLRYKQAVMGIIWAVFTPLMVVFSGSVLKFVMATVSGQPLELISFANMSVKAIAWAFFIGILTNGANSLLGNINLITKIYFPREVFPISAALTQIFDTAVGAVLLFTLLAWVGIIQWTLNLLWIPLLAVLLLFMALAVSMLLSCAMVFYRDVKYLLNVFSSFGIFFSPVFFETAQLGPRLGSVMMLNPVAPLLEGCRLVIVDGHNLIYPLYDAQNTLVWHPAFLLYSALLAILGLLFAWRYFHLKEKLYAEFI